MQLESGAVRATAELIDLSGAGSEFDDVHGRDDGCECLV